MRNRVKYFKPRTGVFREEKTAIRQRQQRRRRIHTKGVQLLQGRLRLILMIGGAACVLLLLILLLRPTSQLISTPEIARAQRLGVLRVGVRDDIPGFSENGAGLEVQLARAMAKQIFPDLDPDIAMELIPVTEYSALAKLRSGDIDITFSLQRNRADENFAYSDPYYYDTVCILCRPEHMNASLEGKKIALIDGTVARMAYSAYIEREKSTLDYITYASYPDMMDHLRRGMIDFVAVPGVQVRQAGYLDEGDIVLHRERLGEAAYVAVSTSESPAFSLLASVVTEQLANNGQLDAWVEEYGLARFRYRK